MQYRGLEFDWDIRTASANKVKHGIAFTEAATVFGDPLSVTCPDPDHSDYEQRFVTLGKSDSGNIILIAHADEEDRIRIISARKATRKEKRFYEEGK